MKKIVLLCTSLFFVSTPVMADMIPPSVNSSTQLYVTGNKSGLTSSISIGDVGIPFGYVKTDLSDDCSGCKIEDMNIGFNTPVFMDFRLGVDYITRKTTNSRYYVESKKDYADVEGKGEGTTVALSLSNGFNILDIISAKAYAQVSNSKYKFTQETTEYVFEDTSKVLYSAGAQASVDVWILDFVVNQKVTRKSKVDPEFGNYIYLTTANMNINVVPGWKVAPYYSYERGNNLPIESKGVNVSLDF